MTTLIVVGVIVVLLLFVVVGAYNRLVALDQTANQSFADIDVQLKQRQDLIPNLIETVKGYAAHEKGTLDAVIQARNAATSANSVNDKVQAENMLTGALGKLFALSEAYPDLKANTNFLQMQADLSDIENKLAAARRFFNNAVSEFNAIRRQFPTVLFAGMVGFGTDKPFFDVGKGERATMNAAPPTVNFQA
ncbi:LemA family protein [uncultured Brevundimonas sp.]|uniref:LemA family protein n=1 Tax=uncultured Brevundimonas sp. TaxID=213418 RepID=UPI0030ED752E|tara:strand:+ start:32743 stop:33318 length:576 start_codon:yes stop_codon:yes gene_type:complete